MSFRFRGTFVADLVLAVLVFLVILETATLPDEVQLVPALIARITFVLLLLALAGHFFPAINRWTEATLEDLFASRPGGAAEKDASVATIFRMMVYAAGYWLLVLYLGMYVVPPVLITLYLVFEARVRVHWAALSAVLATAILIVGMKLLLVDVWLGAASEIVPGYVGGAVMPTF